jgi:hypothetical protein
MKRTNRFLLSQDQKKVMRFTMVLQIYILAAKPPKLRQRKALKTSKR